MAQRTDYQKLVMDNFRRESSSIVAMITVDEVKDIARKLNDDGLLLKREYETVCHKEKTATEAAECLVDYVQKKDIFQMTETFLIMLRSTRLALVNKIMPPDNDASDKVSGKQISTSTGQENAVSSSSASLKEDTPTVTGEINSNQPAQQPTTSGVNGQEENDKKVYKMDKSPHGLCLIINIVDFHHEPGNPKCMPGLSQRQGSDIDAERLRETFQFLNYTVIVERNLDSTSLMETLNKYGCQYNHNNFDSFVCCILTHGSQDHIFGSDSRLVPIVDLKQPFVARKCLSLLNKPKMFFIQACQGVAHQQGSSRHSPDDWSVGALPTHYTADCITKENTPDEADFLMSLSTVPGYVSFRSTTSGSVYIRTLCDVLTKSGHKLEILEILREVNNLVSKETIVTSNGQSSMQMPEPKFTLRCRLFLRPVNKGSTVQLDDESTHSKKSKQS